MTDVFNVVYADIKPERSLKDTWAEFATSLRAGGVGDEQLGDMEITPEKPYVSRYRFIVHDGPLDKETVDRLWNDFAQPPQVEVVAP